MGEEWPFDSAPRFNGTGYAVGEALLQDAPPRNDPMDMKMIGERVTILPNGEEFRTFVSEMSGYAAPTLSSRPVRGKIRRI